VLWIVDIFVEHGIDVEMFLRTIPVRDALYVE
jgi:hypothetical protein